MNHLVESVHFRHRASSKHSGLVAAALGRVCELGGGPHHLNPGLCTVPFSALLASSADAEGISVVEVEQGTWEMKGA